MKTYGTGTDPKNETTRLYPSQNKSKY